MMEEAIDRDIMEKRFCDNELLNAVAKIKEAECQQKNISIKIDFKLEKDAVEKINLSAIKVSGLVQNLLDNAVKYSGDMPQITVICYQKRGTFVIEIRDNGPGIPKKQQKYIFNKYYQANKNSTSKKGYGLGLNYVYNVIKAHKGKITVDSLLGKGCTFTIYLRKWKKK